MQELKKHVDALAEELENFELDVMLDEVMWKVSPHIDGMKTYAQDGWFVYKTLYLEEIDLELELSIIATWNKYPLEISLDLGLYDTKEGYRRGLGEVVLLVDKMQGGWTYLSCIAQSVADAYRSGLDDVDW